MQKFSILMSIYYKETTEYFDRAMKSIWDEQSVKPSEIILVLDGKLTDELDTTITSWKQKLGNILKVIPLEVNLGLGDALNEGIKHCSHELVARMDTDDIALPYRFKMQLEIFNTLDIDICSGWISEFDSDENIILSYRKVPELHNQIATYAKKRCPINHPAVMYKKSVVENAGGYMKMMWFEDYYLWCRMILSDAKFYNIQTTLVNMRAGYGQLERRRGLQYAKSEFNLQRNLLHLKFLNNYEFARNVIIRFTARIFPKSIVKRIYQRLR